VAAGAAPNIAFIALRKGDLMKFRFFVIALALSLAVWAQESPSTTAKPETKSCCHHGADAKDSMSCCRHASADFKDSASCWARNKCEAKDGKSCCAGKRMADAKCCDGKDAKECAEQCKKNGSCTDGKCCDKDKSAKRCCSKDAAQVASSNLSDSLFNRR
jgi:hypothetical protein